MERLQISSNLRSGRYIALLVGLVALFILIRSWEETQTVIVCGVLVAIAGFLYYLHDKAKTVEFDEGSMYISRKDVTETVPLAAIYSIKLTMTQVNDRNLWKIKYLNSNGEKSAVRFLPRRDAFEAFKKAVQEKNGSVDIKNWSHSLDFDQ
ncbi:hypothetical protein [Paraflavitalea pollutisoli]|uniref:hypothetical protein n=1 Tax=Paraflavitalea pollutisoli TaxID=3034143 RepID=UPI0023EE1521|nr:hypothetical protein [Paraflavitalea sp. H1-2-19X]